MSKYKESLGQILNSIKYADSKIDMSILKFFSLEVLYLTMFVIFTMFIRFMDK